jgi:TPR repeat protein
MNEHEELATHNMEYYYTCCGKSICGGCDSFRESENNRTCPFCKTDRIGRTDEVRVEEMMKRVEASDASAIYQLGSNYFHGKLGLHQDRDKAMELWRQSANLGSSRAHFALGTEFFDSGDLMKAKFHYEEAAMAGHEDARSNLGIIEGRSGNVERGYQHWIIAASAGDCNAMYNLKQAFEIGGYVSEETMNSTLAAYNSSCAEMRSEARDNFITDHTGER